MVHNDLPPDRVFDEWMKNGLHTALIDLDNTLVQANITELYFMLKRNALGRQWKWRIWFAYFVVCLAPIYLLLDTINREWFQRAFYRRYHAYTLEQIDSAAEALFQEKCRTRLICSTHHLIDYLKQHQVRIILLSTNFEPIVRRFAAYYGVEYKCLQVTERDGFARVELGELPHFKKKYALRFTADTLLAAADSKHDLPVLCYAAYSVVVSNRAYSWLKRIKGHTIRVPRNLLESSY